MCKRIGLILIVLTTLTSCVKIVSKKQIAQYENTILNLKAQVLQMDSLLLENEQKSDAHWQYERKYEEKYGYYQMMRTLINILPRLYREADSKLKGFGHLPPFHVIEEFMFDFQCCDGYVEMLSFDEVPSDEVFDKMEELARKSNLNFEKFIIDVDDDGCKNNGLVGEGDEGWYGSGDQYMYAVYLIPGIMVKIYEFDRGHAEFRCQTHVLDPKIE